MGGRRKPGRHETCPEGAGAPRQRGSGVGLQPLPERFRRPRPAGVSPPPALICMALPLPRYHWPAPRPAHCPSTTAGFCAPSRPEVRAAGRLLNRGGGGGGRGRIGARSGDESAAPRVGGGGRAARDHFSSPHHGRTEGAAAEGSQGAPAGEWPASQRRAKGGGSPLLGTRAARGGESGEDRRVDLRARRPIGNSLAPRILWAVGLRVPAQDCALGQGSDRSQI